MFGSSSRERRRYPRNAVRARVQVLHSEFGSFEARSRDISDGGLYLMAAAPPPLTRGITLKLQLLDSLNPAIVFNTKVARGESEGFALEIINCELGGNAYPLNVLREQWDVVKQVFN